MFTLPELKLITFDAKVQCASLRPVMDIMTNDVMNLKMSLTSDLHVQNFVQQPRSQTAETVLRA